MSQMYRLIVVLVDLLVIICATTTMFIYLLPLILIPTVVVFLKIYGLMIHRDCRSHVCLVGKTALVTGGNSGIGYQIVLGLVQRGCRVIIADVVERKDLLESIFKETQSRNVVFKYVDLSSLRSVRDLVDYIVNTEEKLDILINNAGIGNLAEVTQDGLDKLMQVNYFSAFLLTHLVIDLLKRAKGRIIFTSSILSHLNNFSLNKLYVSSTKAVDKCFHYPNSKLCLLMIGDIFAEKLHIHGVTSNSYHPGVACTNIFRSNIYNKKSAFSSFVAWSFHYFAFFIGKSAEEGAQTAIYLSCANEVKNVSGKFFSEMRPTFTPNAISNKKLCRDVWEITENLVKLKPNERI